MKPLVADGKGLMEKARSYLQGDCKKAYADFDPTNIYAWLYSNAQSLILERADISNAYLYGDLYVHILM